MISFMDRDFCLSYRNNLCYNHECRRALTPELQERAKEWAKGWCDHVPVAFSDISTDHCPDAILNF